MHVPVPQNLQFGTVDPKTGTWELTDKSLGAGLAVGAPRSSAAHHHALDGTNPCSKSRSLCCWPTSSLPES